MYFIASKIAWALIQPLNLVFILLLFGIFINRFKPRFGWNLIIGACALLFLSGVTTLGPSQLAKLENTYQQPQSLPSDIRGIIVLGGAFDNYLSGQRQMPVSNDALERVLEGLRLAALFPQASLIFSGGDGSLTQGSASEADIIKGWMELQGIDPGWSRVTFEGNSRNTYENALFTKALLKPQPQDKWVLVTSAYHMPRAVLIFRSLGWNNLIPWPTDYKTDGKFGFWPQRFDVIGITYQSHLALHEYAGIFAYGLKGKIASLQ